MEREDLQMTPTKEPEVSRPNVANASHIVTADSVQAEEVPTVPIDSLHMISALQPEISIHSVASTHTLSNPAPLVAQPAEYQRSLHEWVQIWRAGLRPAYLPLALMPVLLGSVLAWIPTITQKTPFGHFHLTHFIGIIVLVLLAQSGAHLINDYYDYLRGVDTSNGLGSGGLIQQGYCKPVRVLECGLALLGLGALCGLVLSIGNAPLLYLFGLLVVLCAYFYSATNYALSTRGLGEVTAFVVFGPLLTLIASMLQTGGPILPKVLIYSLPLGLLATAVIHANNMRDLEGDAHAHKHTLAGLLGLYWSRIVYVLLALGAYAIVIVQGLPHGAPHTILLSLWTLPMLAVAVTGVLRTNAPAGFHMVLRQTLKMETFFAFWLIVGLLLSTIVPVLPHIPEHLLPW